MDIRQESVIWISVEVRKNLLLVYVWLTWGRNRQVLRSCSVHCLLPRQQPRPSLALRKELCRVGGSSWEGMENTIREKQSFIVPGALELMSFAFQRWRAFFRPSKIHMLNPYTEKAKACGGGGERQHAESRGQRPLFGCKYQSAVCMSLPELHMLSFSVCTENCDK